MAQEEEEEEEEEAMGSEPEGPAAPGHLQEEGQEWTIAVARRDNHGTKALRFLPPQRRIRLYWG